MLISISCNTFGGGIKHGRLLVPLDGKDNSTAKGNWVVVDFSKLDDDTSTAFSDLYDMLSYSPMDMLKLLELIHLGERVRPGVRDSKGLIG